MTEAMKRLQGQLATVSDRMARDTQLGRQPAREDMRRFDSLIGRAVAEDLGDLYEIPWARVGDGGTFPA